jgi:ATPase subunit of ABC transporter with duplicated ATPase domains
MKSAAPDLGDVDTRKTLGSFLFSGDDVHKPAKVLSGGEKTRLSLAMLVVSAANVLLLDEPTNNLDPASREEILGALRTYKGAVVLVSHDEGAVAALEPERVWFCPMVSRTTGVRTISTSSPSPSRQVSTPSSPSLIRCFASKRRGPS